MHQDKLTADERPRKVLVDPKAKPSGHVFMKDALADAGVEDRFEFIMSAAQRAKDLRNGETPRVPLNGDNAATVALREARGRKVSLDDLRERAIESRRKVVEEKDEPEDSVLG